MDTPRNTPDMPIRRADRRAAAAFGDKTGRRAFTLLELIVVVVIIAILAAIAIPRLSRGAEDSDVKATQADTAILQRQIDLYAAEHQGVFPAAAGDGTNAAETEAAFLAQLLRYTDAGGTASASRSGSYVFGPYLRKGMPALKLGANAGATGVKVVSGSLPAFDASTGIGWLYTTTTGQIAPNTTINIEAGDIGNETVQGLGEGALVEVGLGGP